MEIGSRRRACDLCFKKKIRCDGLKPTCSNCSLYKISCKTTAIRKGPSSRPKQRLIADAKEDSPESSSPERAGLDGGLHARLARIEAKLDNLQNTSGTDSSGPISNPGASYERLLEPLLDANEAHNLPLTRWASPRGRNRPLIPPLIEATPIIQTYFRNYNSVIPLFDEQSFMRLVNDYYKPYGEKPGIYGAIINVVLSLGYRVQVCEQGDAHAGFNEIKIKTCVDNVQTMLGELMTRVEDTLGLQGLLGLVILYQTYPDQTASAAIMSVAMRLAHSLRLESSALLSELPPQEALRRTNLFWICYMLDKDVSLRTATPSLQAEGDIDVRLPGSDNDDLENLLYTADGLSQFHLFRARVQLAHIEGRIYDTLFSNRSRKLSHEARAEAVLQIDRLLERWEQSVPAAFRLENMSGNLLSGPLVHMTVMYQTYLMCLTMTHGPYVHGSSWLETLGGMGYNLLHDFTPRGHTGIESTASSSSTPAAWERCVTTGRAVLQILSYQSLTGCSIWLSACAYFSAVTFVLAHLIYHPSSEAAEADLRLAELSMLHLQSYFDHKGLERFKELRQILERMGNMAKSALNDAQEASQSLGMIPVSTSDRAAATVPHALPPSAGILDTDFGYTFIKDRLNSVSGLEGAEGLAFDLLNEDIATYLGSDLGLGRTDN